MVISYRDAVYIAVIVLYVPALAVAILLAVRHRRGSNASWIALITFAIARILGASLQLATLAAPTNLSLRVGSANLAVDGLSPLLIAAAGLLVCLQGSMNRTGRTYLKAWHLRLVNILTLVAFILITIGYSNLSAHDVETGIDRQASVSIAATIFFLISYAGIILATLLVGLSASHASPDETRLLIAVALSEPFLLIRVLYICLQVLANSRKFSPVNGSVTIFLCVALLEEFVVVLIYEAVGLTQPVLSKEDRHVRNTRRVRQYGVRDDTDVMQQPPITGARPQSQPNTLKPGCVRVGQATLAWGQRTLIGRILVSRFGERSGQNVEMR